MKSKDLRELAISHFKKGKKPAEIEKILDKKAHLSTICRWIDSFKDYGQIVSKVSTGRPRTARTKRLINQVKRRLKSKNPRKTTRTMGNDFGSNKDTVRRILADLGKKPYRKIKVQKLAFGHDAKRKQCCTWIRKNFSKARVHKMMFTDEKIFTRNGYFNPKNDVIWANSRSEANESGGIFEIQKFPISVMVSLGASWEGLTTPFFFVGGERLNANSYCEVLDFFKSEGDRLFKNTNWTFQQDGASSHTSDKAQEKCKKIFQSFIPKERWPPNSPELNPLDYSIWAKISSLVDYKKVTSKVTLINQIKKSIEKIDQNYLREVIGSFLKRVYSVEKNDGKLIFEKYS